MKILVTGATGMLGRLTVAALEGRRGIRVVATASRSAPSEGLVELDLARPEEIDGTIDAIRPDAIIHLGAVVGAKCDVDLRHTEVVNEQATGALAAAAHRYGVRRIVFASTSAVYGDQYHAPVPEDGALDLRSTYARTKANAEAILRSASEAPDAPTVVALRIFNVWGESFRQSLVTRLLGASAAAPVHLRGLDEFVRDYIHADDVVAAIDLSLSASIGDPFALFNIGTGQPTSNRVLLERLRPADSAFVIEEGSYSYACADISSARRVLGFAPTRTLPGGPPEPRP